MLSGATSHCSSLGEAKHALNVSQLSLSDYGTGGSSLSGSGSDDDHHSDVEMDRSARALRRATRTTSPSLSLPCHPGICPHCKKVFVKPLTLQCGHSLCTACCHALLQQTGTGQSLRRTRIRMGLSSVSYSRLDKNRFTTSSSSMRSQSSVAPSPSAPVAWRSPQCVVCNERPKTTPPVPNIELENFLVSLKHWKLTEHHNPAYREQDERRRSCYDTEDEMDGEYRIREINIAVVGAAGVGKTSLTRVQFGNDMLFSHLLGGGEDDMDSTFMIDILDGNNTESNTDRAHGAVIVYSVTDRDSFYEAADLYKLIRDRRGDKFPVVLVGSKCDASVRRRRVASYEGQSLARQMDCPFLEVSAKKNDCVNEAFTELMRLVESRQF